MATELSASRVKTRIRCAFLLALEVSQLSLVLTASLASFHLQSTVSGVRIAQLENSQKWLVRLNVKLALKVQVATSANPRQALDAMQLAAHVINCMHVSCDALFVHLERTIRCSSHHEDGERKGGNIDAMSIQELSIIPRVLEPGQRCVFAICRIHT